MPKPTGKIRTKRSFNNIEVEICNTCGKTFTHKEIKALKLFWNHTRFCVEDLETISMDIRYQTLNIEPDTCFNLEIDN